MNKMYIVFTVERVEDYWDKIPVIEIVTKYKDKVDNFILSCYNNIEDYLLVEVTNDEFKYLDGNKYLYDILKED